MEGWPYNILQWFLTVVDSSHDVVVGQRHLVHAQGTCWWAASQSWARKENSWRGTTTQSRLLLQVVVYRGQTLFTLGQFGLLPGILVVMWVWYISEASKRGFDASSALRRRWRRTHGARHPSSLPKKSSSRRTMAPSLIRACRSLALSTWLVSFCFVHLLCLDFTVAEKEEWYTAFVNITYLDPVTSQVRTEKTECGRYGEHSPKKEARGLVLVPALLQDRQGCDPNIRFPPAPPNTPWVALVATGNCTYREKIRNVANHNASAVVIYNVGSTSANDTITMSHSGKRQHANSFP